MEIDEEGFLRCFDQLSEFDVAKRKEAVIQILIGIENDKGSNKIAENPDLEDAKNKYKYPLSMHRSYKYRHALDKNSNLLQYTVDRLLRGLKSNRKNSGVGFSVALLSVFTVHKDSISFKNVLAAVFDYTSLKDCKPSEIKDAARGRLFALFILQKVGYFRGERCLEDLENIYKSIWDIYDSKIYFQDAACWLLFLVSKDVFEITGDTKTFLGFIKGRLSLVLNEEFVEMTLSKSVESTKSIKADYADSSESTNIGKCLEGVLPCALFGLYIRLHSSMFLKNENADSVMDTAISLSPLSDELFSVSLKYVSHIPRFHPVIGSFFSSFVDLMLKSSNVEERIQKLWNSINFTMLDPDGGSTMQRIFVGFRLASVLFIKAIDNCILIQKMFASGCNYFKCLSRYSKSPRGHPLKDIANYSIQLLVSIFQGADSLQSNFLNASNNPVINDYLVYADIEETFMNLEVDEMATKKIIDYHYPAICRVSCICSIAEHFDFSISGISALHKIIDTILRTSPNINENYQIFESKLRDLGLNGDFARIRWLLEIFQSCISQCSRARKMELLERLSSASSLCLSVKGPVSEEIYISLASLGSESENRMSGVTFIVASHFKLFSENKTLRNYEDENINSEAREKCVLVSKYLLNLFLTLFSRALYNVVSKPGNIVRKDDKHGQNHIKSLKDTIKRAHQSINDFIEINESFNVSTPGDDSIPVFSKDEKFEGKTVTVVSGKMMNDLGTRNLSGDLLKLCGKVGREIYDEQMSFIQLYGYSLSLLLLIIDYQPHHLSKLSLGLVISDGGSSLISNEKLKIITDFAEVFIDSLNNNGTKDEICRKLASPELLTAILTQEDSPVFGLFHTICKGLWQEVSTHIDESLQLSLMGNSLLEYSKDTVKVDDAESDDTDDEESEHTGEDEKSDHTGEDEKSDYTGEDEESYYTGEDGDSEHSDVEPDGEDYAQDSNNCGSEDDVKLSVPATLEELLDDSEEKLEILRSERRILRGMAELTPESLKLKIIYLDLLQTFLLNSKFGNFHLECIYELFLGLVKSVGILNKRKLQKNTISVIKDYFHKAAKVISLTTKITQKKLEVDSSGITMKHISDLMIEILNSQCRAESCKDHSLMSISMDLFGFLSKLETSISNGYGSHTTNILKMAFLSVAMNRRCKLKTALLLRLSDILPEAFYHIDLVKIAIISNVNFIQNEIISICTKILNKFEPALTGKGTIPLKDRGNEVASKELFFAKGVPKEHMYSGKYITKDFLSSALRGLPALLDKLTKNATSNKADEILENDNGKREIRRGGSASPQLVKSIARLITTVIGKIGKDGKSHKVRQVQESLVKLIETLENTDNRQKKCLNSLNSALNRINKLL